jgi:hypothetical protein
MCNLRCAVAPSRVKRVEPYFVTFQIFRQGRLESRMRGWQTRALAIVNEGYNPAAMEGRSKLRDIARLVCQSVSHD